tara:strand:+ start:8238 stop:8978 length:741 start_codon:yes stop_codon:yes gene_type:complete
MLIEKIILLLIIPLVALQSIVGIGVLVIGTPTLLLLDLSIIDTIAFLLPISIITSFLNILITKIQKRTFYNKERFKKFFIICLPSVFIGLLILKILRDYINFNYLVSLIIIFSLIFKNYFSNKIRKLKKNLSNLILIIIGIVHGITNSGGTLLSIFLVNIYSSKNDIRSETNLFYFFLALTQFILFCVIFDYNLIINKPILIVVYTLIGVILGNFFAKIIDEEIFKKVVYLIALLAAMSLIIMNIF